MNKNILSILEFHQVKVLFIPFLRTAQGQKELEKLDISTELSKIKGSFSELSEFEAIISENGPLQLRKTKDLTEILHRLRLRTTLSSQEFTILKGLLSAVRRLQQYFDAAVNVKFPVLRENLNKLTDLSPLNRTLSVFDEEGTLKDEASNELFRIRKAVKREQDQTHRLMQELLGKSASLLTENLITLRNGRQVLPVRADQKTKVPGVVQDISSSGQTLYIEPAALVDKSNYIQQLYIEEKNEVARILRELSEKFSEFVPEIHQSAWLLGKIDLLCAKHEFLKKYHASIPDISEDSSIRLYAAFHPLIDEKSAVKNDLLFEKDLNSIVITGPNTGGKTITIKTLGLLTLMAQAGLPITAAEGSSISIFDEIYADIGDEQSIEQSLSTFSSHMTHIVSILEYSNSKSLVLLDELGAGTDPKEGAALAKSILEALRRKKVKVLATTHYPELKIYGLETEGVSNASMEFDIEKMRPTYKFHLGIPGQSNAIEISQRLGLPEMVIDEAKNELTDDEREVNQVIHRLETQSHELEEKLANLRQTERENEDLRWRLDKAYKGIAREKEQQLSAAGQEALAITQKARLEAQEILKQLNDKMQLKPHEVIAAMAELDSLAPDLSKNKVLKKAKAARGLQPGTEVLVTNFGQHGKLLKLEKDGYWTVSIGNVKAKVSESDLEVITSARKSSSKKKPISRKTSLSIKAQLDLRGSRYEEASVELDNYIDQALLANLNQITIVHGIGTGVIRGLVQEKLAKNKHIKSFSYAPLNAGGSGATIATLK